MTDAPNATTNSAAAAQATLSPQARWAADQRALADGDPWRSGGEKLASRAPDGSVTFRDRPPPTGKLSDADYQKLTYAERIAYAESQSAAAPADPAAKPGDPPAADPGQLVKIGDVELTAAQWAEAAAAHALAEHRKLTLPADPNGYKVGTSEKFKPPEGVEFKLDDANPAWGQFRAWAHKHGLSQEALSEAVDVFAGYQVREAQVLQTAAKVEVERLGAAGPARVDAIVTWLKSMGGSDFAPLVNVIRYAPHSGTIRGLETLMQRFTTQGGGSYSGAKREPNQPNKLSDSEYQKLTYAQQKAYAAQFPQG